MFGVLGRQEESESKERKIVRQMTLLFVGNMDTKDQ